jgi:hypothetical protein
VDSFWSIDEDSVVEFELQLLAALDFELAVFHVHDDLKAEARALGAHVRVTELAWAIATELYTTDTVLAHAPRPLARAALAVAYAQLRRDGLIPEALTSDECDSRALADVVRALRRRAVALGELGHQREFSRDATNPAAETDSAAKDKRGSASTLSGPAESPGTASACSASGSTGSMGRMSGSHGSSASLWRSDSFASICCATSQVSDAITTEADMDIETNEAAAKRLAEKRERAERAASAERAALEFLGAQSMALGRSIRKETQLRLR